MPRPDDRRVALEALPQSRSEAKTKGEVRRHCNENDLSTRAPFTRTVRDLNESECGKSVNGNSESKLTRIKKTKP